jgi:hypothetical protein
MKTQHTPGPWFLNGPWNIYADRTAQQMRGKCVAQIVKQGNTEEREANARLIAAAPELLAALESLVSDAYLSLPNGNASTKAIDYARAAIAKAVQS